MVTTDAVGKVVPLFQFILWIAMQLNTIPVVCISRPIIITATPTAAFVVVRALAPKIVKTDLICGGPSVEYCR